LSFVVPNTMAVSVVMPALELAQETGKLLAWRKREGERVAKGEPLLEVETDKAVVEIEAPADGILAGVKAYEGAVVPVGKTIAWIVLPGELPPAEAAPSESSGRAATGAAPPASATTHAPEQPVASGARISPKARRLAREHAIDISSMRGTGSGGEILASDVLALVESRPAPASTGLEMLGPIGRLMAERTTQSWTSVPHFFVVREVDAGALVAAREQLGSAVERAHGVRPTHTDFLVALAARVLVKHPRVNASWTGEGIRLHQEVNIGLAMAASEGVVATVIRSADTTSLGEIAVQRRDLTERARANRLRPPDIAGATFTISNLGMYRVDAFSAIINPPQAAILAVGRIGDRVVPVDGRPGIRPMMTMTLSCDHRVVDGARAAAFLNDLADAIREPESWLR
jgi:pyruvate dehydrogenase E2 component (dihydrolipoamide acetyltransferase)